ncbi:hypothetical protein PIGHUM_02172 [Pigmentiphaga humi]|uniref:Transmembrane protein EpsG n=1 Tax=Pigmentiphaga humi TaxID=2478468 RepID=A0A3P4B4M3_9BURK|nr:EpsG family protein [Pigmentiphaga humi]VCU70105.1 hypothetical protein PIGHUM_02172 [Pigmentiphaga humi]
MLPYWVLFFCVAWMAITHMRPVARGSQRAFPMEGAWLVAIALLTLMIGWRHEVGGDWVSYLWHIDAMEGKSFGSPGANGRGDPAYTLLNWLGANWVGGVYFVNLVCAAIFSVGLAVFCRSQPRPWLALAVAVPYLVVVVAMGYTRQGVAIGLAMLGMAALQQRGVVAFLFWIAVAGLFHKSAIVLVPLVLFSGQKNRLMVMLGVVLVCLVLYVLLLQESIDNLKYGYVDKEYDSSGAAIRVAMNCIPAILFLLFRKRFRLDARAQTFWTWMSVSGVMFVPLLMVSSSSTAVDRVALYWIPLQLFVLSRLPDVFGRFAAKNQLVVFSLLGYSASILAVWLFFASHAFAWLPYQFYPWVFLWQ